MMRLGIDFGTSYSSAALILDGIPKPIKEPVDRSYSFPSCIFVTEKGEILVGQAAENARGKNPAHYRHEFKRDLGSSDPYSLGNYQMLPEELIAEVLKKLKTEADKVAIGRGEQAITDAILTIPATYQPYKRKLMQEAAFKAGFSTVELLEEPVGAAIYYSHHAKVQEGDIILVYDLGGGTFDATLIQKTDAGFQMLGMPRGLAHCGGIDFDRQIFQELKSRCSRELRQQLETQDAYRSRIILAERCRELKHQLSEQEEATIDLLITNEVFTLNRDEFNQIIAALIEETLDCCEQLLRSAGIDWQQINYLLLVGGSCRIPYVTEALTKRFGRSPLLVDEPELAVCLGAVMYGTELEQVTSEPIPINDGIEQDEREGKETETDALDTISAKQSGVEKIIQYREALQSDPINRLVGK